MKLHLAMFKCKTTETLLCVYVIINLYKFILGFRTKMGIYCVVGV